MSDVAETSDVVEMPGVKSAGDLSEKPAGLSGENDNRSESNVRVADREIHPLVRRGAGGLIDYHRREHLQFKRERNPVAVESWGTAEQVYEELATQLEYYKGRALAEEMAREMVAHAQGGAEGLRNHFKANIISVQLPVAETVPAALFETGALERERIDAGTVKAEVVGATQVQRHLAYGGSAMSSNCADVDAMFAGNKIWSLWPTYQIPNKSELDGMANESALALLTQAMGGGGADIAPELLDEAMATLQKLIEAGLVSPEIMNMIQQLSDLKSTAGMSAQEMKAMAEGILQTLSEGLSDGMIPSEFAKDVLVYLSDLAGPEIAAELKADLDGAEAKIQVQAVSEKLQILAELEGVDPTDRKAGFCFGDNTHGIALKDFVSGHTVIQNGAEDTPDIVGGGLPVILTNIGVAPPNLVLRKVGHRRPEPVGKVFSKVIAVIDLCALLEVGAGVKKIFGQLLQRHTFGLLPPLFIVRVYALRHKE